MGVFDDNPYVSTRLGEPAPTPAQASERDAWAQGDYWTVRRRDAEFELDYLSGELQGRERSLSISDSEAEAIRKGGDAAVNDVLRDHGVG